MGSLWEGLFSVSARVIRFQWRQCGFRGYSILVRALTTGGIMRLTPDQQERIVRAVRDQIGADTSVWLYGSRTKREGRGGDVDLLIRPSRSVDATEQARLHGRLEQELSLPVDVSFIDPQRGMNRFQRLVAAGALPVESP